MQEIDNAIEAIKKERSKAQEKIDEAMSDPQAKSGLGAARAKFNELRKQKNALIEEKKAMRAQMDKVKSETDKLMKDKKDTRSNVKFGSVAEIDKEINKLRRQQETTTMSLTEEKKLIKEVEALQLSKSYIAQLADKDKGIDGAKEEKKTIKERINAKDKEIDAVSKELDAVKKTMDEFNSKDSKKRDHLQDFFKKRDACKKQMAEQLKKKDALRDAFRIKNNAWYNYSRAIRAQKKIEYEAEKAKREEEKAAYLAQKEAEELKKPPYEEEQALCEFLADFLERTYLKKEESKQDDGNKDVVEVKDDPFAGFKAVKKDDDEEYFGKGKGKKKRNRASKKQDTAAPFSLSVDMFEQFGFLMLTPPTSADQVENSVKELREKKEWYKNQPRGSVPTAQEIRKQNEKAAAKVRQSVEKSDSKPAAKKGEFSLSNEDFAPLGAGGGSISLGGSWGQKPAAV